ncbi:hypothetical protein BOTNAR_0016g00140 [Botryotinia narcissicola]|uniref:Uncharacterized protein n=1 Tax=Botryotinia narcissicola TaxID=278944 RepID=A0A4Z1J5K0_9HELO|nr:hypothetical protein BOTNAR_0016g00140 [Botryotinia narcissicola]
MIYVDLRTKGASPQQYSEDICILAALFFKFGRADDTVPVPATIDTSLYQDPFRLPVLRNREEKIPPLHPNRRVLPTDSHSSPDTSSGQSPSRKSEKLCKSKAVAYIPRGSYVEIIAAKRLCKGTRTVTYSFSRSTANCSYG